VVDYYSAGYHQGYETLEFIPPPVAPVDTRLPGLRIRADWINDMNPDDPAGFPDPDWTDITANLRSAMGVEIRRGRQRELDRNEAGQALMLIGDMDADLDPDNLDSPFWPNVVPDRRIQVQATVPWDSDAFTMCSSYVGDTHDVGGGDTVRYITVFDGVTDDFKYNYEMQFDATVEIRAVDLLALLSRDLVRVFNSNQLTVEQTLHMILNYRAYTGRLEGVISGTDDPSDFRDIPEASYPITLQAITYQTAPEPLLTPLQQAEASDGGSFFISRDGRPTFRNRFDSTLKPAKMKISRDVERFSEVEFVYDSTLIYNDITVTGANGSAPVNIKDQPSIRRHPGRPPLTVNTLLPPSSAGIPLPFPVVPGIPVPKRPYGTSDRALELSVTYREPRRVISHLVLYPSDGLEDVLNLDLWDRVDVEVELPGGRTFSQPSLIQGIRMVTKIPQLFAFDVWLSPLPFFNELDQNQSSFEDGSVNGWEAETNCTIQATHTEWMQVGSIGPKGDRTPVYGYGPIQGAPDGQYVLWADSIASNDFSVVGPEIAIAPRANYKAQVAVRHQRYASDGPPPTDYGVTITRGPWRLDLNWYDANHVLLSRNIGTETSSSNQYPQFFLGGWTGLSTVGRAPNGAAYCRLRPVFTGSEQQGMFIDDALLIQSN
jgi:hypothetical protein